VTKSEIVSAIKVIREVGDLESPAIKQLLELLLSATDFKDVRVVAAKETR